MGVVVVAAGAGTRLGADRPKAFVEIEGVTILERAVSGVLQAPVDELVVAGSHEKVQRWSTDPRSRVPALPDVSPGAALPRCVRTVHRGRTLYDRDAG